MPSVTVVTATTGHRRLHRNIESVRYQTHSEISHLVVIDGPAHRDKVAAQFELARAQGHTALSRVRPIQLPYPVGKDGWFGHRVYAASTFLADSDYVMFLDDDNWIAPNHVETCLKAIARGNDWVYAFRNIVDSEGRFICEDNCESLGKWPSHLHSQDFFVDVNCYFLSLSVAIHLGPAWYRKSKQPGEQDADRVVSHVLMNNGLKFDASYCHSVNYTVGNAATSIGPTFFERGNDTMLARYHGVLPWKATPLP